MKIAIWNVNSIKARLDHVKNWLAAAQPDVLMMQELKGMEFPQDDFRALGYESLFVPQKAYNGVATLSRHPMTLVKDRLDGDDADEQARYLETDIKGVRLVNIYLPNGNPVGTEKFPYKLGWMDRLYNRMSELRRAEIPAIVAGDFNIIPEDKDCYNPADWLNDALFHHDSRARFRALLNLGYTDAFRVFNTQHKQYTFWDYQAGSWPANRGIRIDHFLTSPAMTDRLTGCLIDTAPRGLEKASDHTPVVLTFSA